MNTYTCVKIRPDGFDATINERGVGQFKMRASWPLFIIRQAWNQGCSFEVSADGFGKGEGTKGDWSAIRDSTETAIESMLETALNYLFKGAT